ncbi:ribonucleoside-diphosphate reductase, alpha subunit [Hoylesella oralis ATCC 33269]|uniref:Ribonucleoside-diphosphate reductase n=1 Tax=Hoylesella oralis ATCC 33269 TaxID=873533 RepID=E7RLU9_9BACT|nr:ribonucleoside-diphosphate reductase subunit alpha [Hoylesella oralis]EFZ37730.1 ribonucleoside-diphosphate reductase, alpha subunit [Hoylesella oralis ATCC 33269]EPH16910.1 ribonucleoside-diphosphate reductase, alpha subunit [Hoylesella oralis HGA0225]SHF47537.1 ribonucleoside-diphosphate reductase alpha chain [Hoylesella oralis]
MEITKRNGSVEHYDKEKIATAIRKSFISTGNSVADTELYAIVGAVENVINTHADRRNVESIQDEVERKLMEKGFYNEAKSYILFRWKRTEQRKALNAIAEEIGDTAIAGILKGIANDFYGSEYGISALSEKFNSFSRAGMNEDNKLSALIKAAVEMTTAEAPDWEFIAARLASYQLNKDISTFEETEGIHSLYEKLRYLTDEKLYGDYILKAYSEEEIAEAASFIVPERNNLLNYSGIDLLIKRYLMRTYSHRPIESVQEMFLGIALHLAMNERHRRMVWVRKFYDMLSLLQVTMATPTLSNARKPFHQLSSCFIDTVPDSLEGIFRSLDNFAQVSKFGGGMGLYFGKVRAAGRKIRGFKGAAGGVIRWMKLVNDTAVAVDQLGMRQGAAAVYLDVWHKDLPEFLQLRTNNGDDRMKAHDIFPAVCYPDLFWRMAEEDINQQWYMFCPNEIISVKGYSLEDYYGEEWEKRYRECVDDLRISRRVMSIKDIVRLVLRSAVETGTPFTFNRDIVNRTNPNAHRGIIYCSNLCTEIAQNMSEIETVANEIRTEEGDTVVVRAAKPGDFVVCNLASLSLGHLPLEDDGKMKNIVSTVVRALDNVIDLNFYPLHYARITNHRYRSIGLGVSGYHHALAVRGIKWESERHLEFMDQVFERINRAAIEASADLAAEKGAYTYFDGSDWKTGKYFTKRGYMSKEWQQIARKAAQGMRNAYLLAIAPTSSTSIIAGTTAGVDPVMKRFFLEEKKGAMLPRVAPNLSDKTYWAYKGAYLIDQKWSMRAAGIRQKHLDQSQSVNLYITNEYTMRQVLDLYLLAWKSGVKTLYYVRSKSLEVEECESCAS